MTEKSITVIEVKLEYIIEELKSIKTTQKENQQMNASKSDLIDVLKRVEKLEEGSDETWKKTTRLLIGFCGTLIATIFGLVIKFIF